MNRFRVPIFRKCVAIVCVVALLAVLSACGGEKPNDLNFPVADFTYTDQDGKPFGLSNLKGKVWVANFIFTHCTTVCPGMTLNFAQLQQVMKKAGVSAELVSFSVDPERDRPEVLKDYLGKFQADFTNWHALTGYSDQEIQQFARDSFKTLVQNDPNSDQVIHGTKFFLVDQSGTVVTSYDGVSPDFDKIVKDIQALQK